MWSLYEYMSVYRRSGGHSYEYVIPGPIGSILGAKKNQKNTIHYHLHVLYVVLVQMYVQ